MPSSDFFTPKPPNKCRIKAGTFTDCVTSNPVQRSACTNDRPFVVPESTNEQYRESFFVQTVKDWNHLSVRVVNAKTLTSFKEALTKEDPTPRLE